MEDYAALRKRTTERYVEATRGGMPPDRVARAIFRILRAKYPKPRYAVVGQSRAVSSKLDARLWNDHQILQRKLRALAPAADIIQLTWRNSGGEPRSTPTINDELSYQGDRDKHSEADTLESHLGAFLGGGYGTTGWKTGNKLGAPPLGQVRSEGAHGRTGPEVPPRIDRSARPFLDDGPESQHFARAGSRFPGDGME